MYTIYSLLLFSKIACILWKDSRLYYNKEDIVNYLSVIVNLSIKLAYSDLKCSNLYLHNK